LQKYKIVSDELLHFDLKSFIIQNLNNFNTAFILKLSKVKLPFHYGWLADQLQLYSKAQRKIPAFASVYCWFTPKSFEQSSGELSAFYKSGLFKGRKMLDLSAGLGVDDWAFSRSFQEVISIDTDEELNKIVRHNFDKLGINNIRRIAAKAEDFVKQDGTYDLIYIDADRRPNAQGKTFNLKDSSPDVFAIKTRLLELSDAVLVKASPLLDIDHCIKLIPEIVAIHVVSAENEVKELLLLLNKKPAGMPEIKAVEIKSKENIKTFKSAYRKTVTPGYAFEGKYFFEPSPAIIKSGLSKHYAEAMEVNMLAENSHFYISDHLPDDFMGRRFKIIHQSAYKPAEITRYLKEENIRKASISKRNFPLDVDELKTIFKLKDGGNNYLFFSRNKENKKQFYHCVKTK